MASDGFYPSKAAVFLSSFLHYGTLQIHVGQELNREEGSPADLVL